MLVFVLLMTIEENIPLASLTTFQIGGPARFFARVTRVEELHEALDFARAKALKIFILGGGSNVLFDDKGFEGLVIKIEVTGVEERENICIAGAGESWDALVEKAVNKNLWGIENLSGIPGTVGGAVVQNIGAYGAALSQTLLWAEVFDTRNGAVEKLSKDKLGLGYRGSIFSAKGGSASGGKQEEGRYVILRAGFELSQKSVPNLAYKDLATRFRGQAPSLMGIRTAVLDIRAQKFPDLGVEGTAGSFFKNPVLPATEAKRLKEHYPELPLFPLPESADIKVPLGWFLDYRHGVMDLRKVTIGGARMYEKQFLVLVVERNSSSADVKKLADYVQHAVRAKLHIEIEPEVRIV